MKRCPKVVVPRTALAPLLQIASILREDEAEQKAVGLIQATGLNFIPGREPEIAERLEGAMARFVSDYRRAATATPGEHTEWLNKVEAKSTELLEFFGAPPGLGMPTPEVVHAILRDAPVGNVLEAMLRKNMANAAGADMIGVQSAIAIALTGIQYLALLARLSSAELSKKKGGKRTAPAHELIFVKELRDILEVATGELRSFTTDDGAGTGGGPLVTFVMATAALLRERLCAFKPDAARDIGLRESLAGLASKPARVVSRIRQVLSLSAEPPH